MPSTSSRRGFTLIELLVVLGIIALVISILLPTIWKFRRKAAVLVCPIAYIGTDRRVHLTDPNGGLDVTYDTPAYIDDTPGEVGFNYPPVWSSAGTRIAFSKWSDGGSRRLCSLNPMSGAVTEQDRWSDLYGWANDDQILTNAFNAVMGPTYLTADTGHTAGTISPADRLLFGRVTRVPPSVRGYYIAYFVTDHDNRAFNRYCVGLLRKDLSICKLIWEDAKSYPYSFPRVDPMGEKVAWSPIGPDRIGSVLIKRLSDPASKPPDVLIGSDPKWPWVFCDWTDTDRMLVAKGPFHGARPVLTWDFYIIDTKGTIIRRLFPQVPPSSSIVGNCRRYGHQ